MEIESQLQQVGGVWLPKHDTHLPKWMRDRNEIVDGKLTYQYHKLQAALKWCKQFRVAVDVGAHCGLWSMHLAKRFMSVGAFEPVELHRECFVRNTEGQKNVELHSWALGFTWTEGRLHVSPGSSGDSYIAAEGDEVLIRRLDDSSAVDSPVDFIKLDCEGYELFALLGGVETLLKNKPCVCVEQKPGRAQKYGLPERGAVMFLQSIGAKLRAEMSGDFILSWD